MNPFYAVNDFEAKRPRVVIVWTSSWDFEEFTGVCEILDQQEYRIVNIADGMCADEIGLRQWLPMLSSVTHIALDDTWWTSATAHQLVQIAGWVGVKFIDLGGHPIETASLRSVR